MLNNFKIVRLMAEVILICQNTVMKNLLSLSMEKKKKEKRAKLFQKESYQNTREKY